jgi:signal transduction histidine kinase
MSGTSSGTLGRYDRCVSAPSPPRYDQNHGVERGVLAGITAFRWAAWAWLAVVLGIADDPLAHPLGAVVLAGAALAFTVVATVLFRVRPAALLTPRAVAVELAIAVALLAGDGWVYEHGHAFASSQSLGSAWPLAAVLSAGLVLGPLGGAGGGLALGAGRIVGAAVNQQGAWDGGQVLSVTSSTVLYVLAGTVSGFAAGQLRVAEGRISAARAREEVARTLHDGVLQTLAIVQRRVDDPALVRLARDQERELREFLAAGRADPGADLAAALRREAATFEGRFGGRAQVTVADDVARQGAEAVAALVGAVGEALTNAGKHGEATRVTVYVEPDATGVFCSVKDDGQGFDPSTTTEGMGLSRSIRARLVEVGGRVEVDGRPGRGAEIRMWLP